MYELNASGQYYTFKEQLKRTIIKIVREKYLMTSPLADPHERQKFLASLYVFLSDHMHKA